VNADYIRRDGCYYRAGLTYEPDYLPGWNDAEIWHFCPDGPFFVDGIRYEHPLDPDVVHARPMIEVFSDGSGQPARHDPEPVTETQLDRWVHQGGRLGGP
jgi:hypothetical protein